MTLLNILARVSGAFLVETTVSTKSGAQPGVLMSPGHTFFKEFSVLGKSPVFHHTAHVLLGSRRRAFPWHSATLDVGFTL